MTSSHLPTGRGRGRQRIQEASLSLSDVPATTRSTKTDTDVSSTADDVQTVITSPTTTTSGHGRGRGSFWRRQVEASDPEWVVSNLTIDEFKLDVRPSKPMELGTIGQPTTVRVNYFPITKFPEEGLVYQYDIHIWNERDQLIQREHQRILYECWLKEFCRKYPEINRDKIVFDNQKAIFTYDQPLPGVDENGIIEKIKGSNRANCLVKYKISIKHVGHPVDLNLLRTLKEFDKPKSDANINLDDLQNIKRILSIVLHQNCSSQADFIFNRSFFSLSPSQDRHGSWDLGLGKAMWRGFYSCLVFAKGNYKLLMNLDISHKVFMKGQPFLDFLCEVMLHSPRDKSKYGHNRSIPKVTMDDVLEFFDRNSNHGYYDDEVEFLLKYCKNLSVRSQVTNRTIGYVIHGLGKAASTQTFKWEGADDFITVEDYYEQKYGIKLKYPTLPTLSALKMEKELFVPMELVDVVPVKVTKITHEQQTLLCLNSSLKPTDCYDSIKEVRQNPKQQCFEQDPFITAWNFEVDVDMLTVPARILPMPKVICNDKFHVTHEQCRSPGVWNNTQTKFYKPINFPSVWGIINLSSSLDRDACEEFFHQLNNVAADRGIHCPAPVIYREYNVRTHSIRQIIDALKEMMGKNDDCKFYIFILPEDNPIRDQIYGDIKALCELESGFGIVTQMIRMKKNERQRQWSYSRLNNTLQEINTKLGGINSIVSVDDSIQKFFSKGYRTMYVGVDLSHAASGSSRRRSAVAVVASVGEIPIGYLKEIYIQERPLEKQEESWECVVDMKKIMKSLISQYKKHEGYPPNAIIIYRNGISNSEFNTVFEKELTAIREACVELSRVYRPYLTYIVVNRRHHTKIFPEDLKRNVVAGTVVDSHDITNPTTYDFYLNSHHAEKGTSRPAHYHVLYDDNKLKPDQVQMLTYALCYLDARCTRSASTPAPVRYADLLAFRAGIYGNINDESNIESAIPSNEDENATNTVKSERIVLSSKLAADCPFFL